ncbi:carboxyl-terminal processing protease [Brevundimonas alba]|uniref:Carboxyl-terminal processing protease n=1 Tax=Brevundimonas alba TaxID=74314 RepID=A0A7X5YKE7_9CAUL|nr:S41 family peptidase [Brevundimonas alba]NJC41546.1 carboxyl-terminal processing protease [Brevundimonas alba]
MNQRVFDRVWNEVRTQYYDPGLHGVDWNAARRTYRPQALAAADDRALYRVLGEMLDLLDDEHAGASAPAVSRRIDTVRQARPAIGVTLRADPGKPGLYVVEMVREGSPAEAAGVAAGWRLDTTAPGVWYPELDVLDGQTVTLALADPQGVPHTVSITPRVMEPRSPFAVDLSRPGVAVLRIDAFDPGLGDWMGRQLAALPSETDVILDLRGNPGGRLVEADAVLSCFLPRHRAWATRTTRSGRAIVLTTAGGCGDLEGPAPNDVAVLVDANSRSAAELTPAALQEARRAVVVGEQTAGAVLISQDTRLPDGGRLSLSRSDFVTAGGVRLEKRGVTPDLTAPVAEREAHGQDPALDLAIAALSGTGAQQVRAAEPAPL